MIRKQTPAPAAKKPQEPQKPARHILSLTIENFQRLTALHVEPDGRIVELDGPNDSGKTSALRAIWAALGGKDAAPAIPVRKGQTAASTTIDLGDFTVKKVWAKDSEYLTVTDNRTQEQVGSPQTFLNAMLARRAFNPIRFLDLPPKAQAEELCEMLGLDFRALDAEQARVYAERTVVNRQVKAAKQTVANMPLPAPETPDEEASIADLLAERDALLAKNQKIRDACKLWEDWEAEVERCKTAVYEAQIALEAAEKSMEAAKAHRRKLPATAPADDLDARIASAEETNALVRDKIARSKAQAAADAAQAASDKLTARLDAIKVQRAETLAATGMPVDGLSVRIPEEGGDPAIFYNDLPLGQEAYSGQIRITAALAFHAAPELRVLLIDNGSEVGPERMQTLADVAEEYDAQIWIAKVMPAGSGDGIRIVDGHQAPND